MIPEYHYQVHDDSIITPMFKKWIVAPLFRFIPWWLPANIITIISNMFMYVALFCAIMEYPADRPLRFIIIAILILAYAIGDHLDGMQAKRTATSSPLGELCDHFLDIFNTGILLYILYLMFEIDSPEMLAVIIGAGYMAHAVIFFEQFHTKCLRFDRIGSLETILASCIVMFLMAIEPVYSLALTPMQDPFTPIGIIFLTLSSGAVITFAKVVLRITMIDIGCWLFSGFLVIVTVTSVWFLPAGSVFYVITAYSAIYIGNIQRGHLCDGKNRYPDIVVPIYMLICFIIDYPLINWALYTYLAVRVLWIAIHSFWTLRHFWMWKNPPQI